VTRDKLESRFRAFGRSCHLIVKREESTPPDILGVVEHEFRRLEAKYDSSVPSSLVGMINQRAGSGVFTPLDAEARSLFNYTRTLWQESNHLFDPTTFQFQRYYNDRSGNPPSASRLEEGLSLVGWNKLEVSNEGAHLSQEGMVLDLNGCIRAYGTDQARKILLNADVSNALIDFDKDVATIGKQPDGANWLVGMRYPDGSRTAIERFKVNHKGYAVRGNFENSLTIGGERYSRIYSPVDGQPIPGLLGVAVIADNCLTACSATSIARLKPESIALNWLDKLGLPWLAIDRKLNCHGPLVRHHS